MPAITRLLRNAGLTISVLVLLGGATDFSLSYFLSHQFNNNQKVEVAFELSAIRAKIEERLNVNLYLVYGVAASIAAHDGISSDDFNELAQISLSQSDALRNIAAAPDFVIRYVYPLRGNEAAWEAWSAGLDYRLALDGQYAGETVPAAIIASD